MKLSKADQELIAVASEHAKKHYERDFISIGGALRTRTGKIYTGINLKYRVRNVSACAETLAIYSALNDGETDFDTIVGVKYIAQEDRYEVVNACGWCRQLFVYNQPLKIITNNDGHLEIHPADELLPFSFL